MGREGSVLRCHGNYFDLKAPGAFCLAGAFYCVKSSLATDSSAAFLVVEKGCQDCYSRLPEN
jgi:hypothetical protein